ncbi:unnamed protein product [Linum tenue]|uniref:Uncharacterized protein n=1 Tax=Linum tenue TaxID=586396 RepID=A0AAV0S263_9ROSI|nr:unnamed protein product [Linum tenue]
MATRKVTLKLLINKKTKKVLFAEAGKDFVDFLFTLLSFPLGTVIKLLSRTKWWVAWGICTRASKSSATHSSSPTWARPRF